MHRTKNIQDLMPANDLALMKSLEKELKNLKSEFNFFFFFGDVIGENTWSKMFSFLLDSSSTHKLSKSFFQYWLQLISKENSRVNAFWDSIRSANAPYIQTSTEWCTPAGRRLDILIEILDAKGKISGFMGIENKVDSGEQELQVSDYQDALIQSFPDVPKIILFVSPDGRESLTAADNNECPCAPVSYSAFQNSCSYFADKTEGEIQIFLKSLSRYLRMLLIKYELSELRTKLTAKLSKASDIVDYSEMIPFFNRMKEAVLDPDLPVPFYEWAYKSFSTNEMKVFIEDLRMEFEGHHLVPIYMLHSDVKEPRAGDQMVVRLMLHYQKIYRSVPEEKAAIKERFLKEFAIPNNRNSNRHWANLINIWTSEAYTFTDLGEADLKNLKELLLESIHSTYSFLEKKLLPYKGRI